MSDRDQSLKKVHAEKVPACTADALIAIIEYLEVDAKEHSAVAAYFLSRARDALSDQIEDAEPKPAATLS